MSSTHFLRFVVLSEHFIILFSLSLAFSYTLFFTFYVVAVHDLNAFLIFLEEATLLRRQSGKFL